MRITTLTQDQRPRVSGLGRGRVVRAASLAGVFLMTAGAAVWAQAPPQEDRQKQIEEIRRQIGDLSKRLDELSKEGTAAGANVVKATTLPEGWLKNLRWRSIGPANMGGRITAIAVYEEDPTIYYVATASGGLLKTENNGLTFKHLFDKESTVSIGDVAVAASDKNVVWVGTGESNPRNSVSYGNGVYKSTDGGKTWENMGLKESYQIGRIVIHPKDPNIVYVGALGRLWGANAERGLFKTTDGGKTWEKILFVDDKTGVIELVMHPTEPDTLLVATYERGRDMYDSNEPSVQFGAGAGMQKTTDGGKSWTKVTKGLPTSKLGRVGLSWYRKDPKIVYAIVESETIGTGPPGAGASSNVYAGVMGTEDEEKAVLAEVVADGPAAKAGLLAGDEITEFDGAALKGYSQLIEKIREKKSGDEVKLKIKRGEETKELTLKLAERPAQERSGRAPRDPKKPFLDFLGGQRENVQGRQGDDGFEHGGVYRSDDGGESWARINSLNPRPMYFSQIRVDPSDDKHVYVLGISLYRSSDGGKSFKSDGGRGVHADHHALWIDPKDGRHMRLGGDGGIYVTHDRMTTWDHLNHMALGQFYDVAVDSTRNYNVFGGLQDNGTWGGPNRLLGSTGPLNEDWFNVGSGDGFQVQVDPSDANLVYFTSQNGGIGRRNLKTGEFRFFQPRPPKDETYRWNWNTPFVLSPTNPKIYTVAGNKVFRSLKQGDALKVISPEITKTDKGSATALAESPINADVLYVGTDDGALWVTKDGGKEWTEIGGKVGLPKPMHVATIEASRFAEGRVYVAFDGHRSDLDAPFAFASDDYGQTWRSLNGGLPERGSSRCVREDIVNPELLFVGTEFGAFASIDGGRSWTSLNTNLPTVAVHDFAIHPDPNVGEVVAGTHGRSLWVLDATPLRQASAAALAEAARLYKPGRYEKWHGNPSRGLTNRRFTGENPQRGLSIYYHLREKPEKVSLKIYDAAGNEVRTLPVVREAGLHRSAWDLGRVTARRPAAEAKPAAEKPASEAASSETQAPAPAGEGTESSGEGSPAPQPTGRQRTGGAAALMNLRPREAETGTYRVVLNVDGKEFVETVQLDADPRGPAETPAAGGEGEEADRSNDGIDEPEEMEQEADDRIDV